MYGITCTQQYLSPGEDQLKHREQCTEGDNRFMYTEIGEVDLSELDLIVCEASYAGQSLKTLPQPRCSVCGLVSVGHASSYKWMKKRKHL